MKIKKIDKTLKKKQKSVLLKKPKKPENGLKNNKEEDEISYERNSSVKSKKKVTAKGKKKINKDKDEITLHKKELESLQEFDPEFYKFLRENDKKLLEFNFNDTDSDEEENDEKNTVKRKDSDNEDNEIIHKPKEELEVASDESDYENEDEEIDDDDVKQKGSKVITLKLLRNWQGELEAKHVSAEVIRKVIQAFKSVLVSMSGDQEKKTTYKVEGSASFNGVIQLCVLHLQPAIYRFLGIKTTSKKVIHKCPKWKKIRSSLRLYLTDVVKLLEHVSSVNILTVLLKHLHQMAAMISSFPTISKPILKRLINLWSTSEETVRVLAFLCMLKIIRSHQGLFLNHVLKSMYLSYIRNSKFVSPNTLPAINFMRRSLVEVFLLDLNMAYQHAFLFIRQLAIHLRNAIILKKKDSFQAVYNWQFINSIKLWAELLSSAVNKSQLEPLIYPLVCITMGVIKLIPTAQFFPLRFHCVQALITLASRTNIFVPVIPFILEVLNSSTFNKKHTTVSMKPMQFTCILRLNKPQMDENGFRDEVVENVCNLLLEYLTHESSSIAFPDLAVPTVVALKQYLKNCKNPNHSRKLKTILNKIIENGNFIEEERSKIGGFNLKDSSFIRSWESKIRNRGTPLAIYYANWVKTHEIKKKRQATDSDNINDFDIPVIKRRKSGVNVKDKNEEIELFPSDDDEDDEKLKLNGESKMNNKQTKEQKKKKKKAKATKPNLEVEDTIEEDDNEMDIVKDLDINDW